LCTTFIGQICSWCTGFIAMITHMYVSLPGIALYTANAYSTEREMLAIAVTRCMAGLYRHSTEFSAE